MSTETTYQTGEHVVLDYPGIPAHLRGAVFTVTKVHKVNIDLAPLSAGQSCRAPKNYVRRATEAELATARTAATSTPPLHLGSVVRKRGAGQLFVVIGTPGGNSSHYRIVALGGALNGTYYRSPRALLELVELNLTDPAAVASVFPQAA
ncbi:hypothetical protein [Nocardia sp. NPDC050435]|uniref:hypothetical protein n=1 Tax=Nocardia sp. NPDC050435 TaxID=3155040 RepID=UPI0033CFF311